MSLKMLQIFITNQWNDKDAVNILCYTSYLTMRPFFIICKKHLKHVTTVCIRVTMIPMRCLNIGLPQSLPYTQGTII